VKPVEASTALASSPSLPTSAPWAVRPVSSLALSPSPTSWSTYTGYGLPVRDSNRTSTSTAERAGSVV
jgi:hypothetical protein